MLRKGVARAEDDGWMVAASWWSRLCCTASPTFALLFLLLSLWSLWEVHLSLLSLPTSIGRNCSSSVAAHLLPPLSPFQLHIAKHYHQTWLAFPVLHSQSVGWGGDADAEDGKKNRQQAMTCELNCSCWRKYEKDKRKDRWHPWIGKRKGAMKRVESLTWTDALTCSCGWQMRRHSRWQMHLFTFFNIFITNNSWVGKLVLETDEQTDGDQLKQCTPWYTYQWSLWG